MLLTLAYPCMLYTILLSCCLWGQFLNRCGSPHTQNYKGPFLGSSALSFTCFAGLFLRLEKKNVDAHSCLVDPTMNPSYDSYGKILESLLMESTLVLSFPILGRLMLVPRLIITTFNLLNGVFYRLGFVKLNSILV
jgi:hypothetical protein